MRANEIKDNIMFDLDRIKKNAGIVNEDVRDRRYEYYRRMDTLLNKVESVFLINNPDDEEGANQIEIFFNTIEEPIRQLEHHWNQYTDTSKNKEQADAQKIKSK
jgi:hypothetical protein